MMLSLLGVPMAAVNAAVKTYMVTFADADGKTVLQSGLVEYGATPIYGGATPTKAPNAQYTYMFGGWSPAVVPVTGEATYTAKYVPYLRSHTVTFVDENGAFLYDRSIPYGQMPRDNGPTPAKAPNAQYTYTFAGWSPSFVPVTGPVTYTAKYVPYLRSHMVTFVDEDGSFLYDRSIPYGQMPRDNGPTPMKAPDAQYTYTFAGWSPSFVPVTGPVTYAATYASAANPTSMLDKLNAAIAIGNYSGNGPTTVKVDGVDYVFTTKNNNYNGNVNMECTINGKVYVLYRTNKGVITGITVK